jgi:hypothetical protein
MRLLAGDRKLKTLLPAVDAFSKQAGLAALVRSSDKFHEGRSGEAPTTLTQINEFAPYPDLRAADHAVVDQGGGISEIWVMRARSMASRPKRGPRAPA